jgi:pentatricopeptide repeat protein
LVDAFGQVGRLDLGVDLVRQLKKLGVVITTSIVGARIDGFRPHDPAMSGENDERLQHSI